MTLPMNFPGRRHERRGKALDMLRSQRAQSLEDWQASSRNPELKAEDLKRRQARQDREIAHLIAIQAKDIEPKSRRTKKVQENTGR